MTVSPRFAATTTRRCRTMLALTRSRSSWRSRPGSATENGVHRARCPNSSTALDPEPPCRGPSRRADLLPRHPSLAAVRSTTTSASRVPSSQVPSAVSARRQHLLAAGQAGRVQHAGGHLAPRRQPLHSVAADGPLPQRPPVALERDELAEHPVVLAGLVDRVGPLQLRLQLGDPAHRGQLLQPEDVRGGVRRGGVAGASSGSTASALNACTTGCAESSAAWLPPRRGACRPRPRGSGAPPGRRARRPPPRPRGRSGG